MAVAWLTRFRWPKNFVVFAIHMQLLTLARQWGRQFISQKDIFYRYYFHYFFLVG
jgi:hypothetical protein